MSGAWETTIDDLTHVLDRHRVKLPQERIEEIFDELDFEEIEKNLLNYCSMDVQSHSMLDDIENHLLAEGIIVGEKLFKMSDVDENEFESLDDEDEE